nr:hypothetical protein [Actinomycetota bacterium]
MDATTGPGRAGTDKAGLAVFIAGLAIAIGALGSNAVDWLWVGILLGFALLVYGLPGVHAYQAPADGAAGRWGALLVRFGCAIVVALGLFYLAWEAIGDPPEEGGGVIDALWMIGFFGFAIGIVLFAIGTIKAKVLPTAAAALMLVGIVAAIAIDMATGAFSEDDAGTTTAWGFLIGVPLFGAALAWIGYTVWKGNTATTTTAAPPPITTPPPTA